jgi:hypothetical protein
MNPPTDQETAKSKSVSLLPSLWERVEAASQGNRSEFVRQAVLTKLDAEAVDPLVLQKLARTYHPLKLARLRQLLADRQALAGDPIEPILVQRLLDCLVEALADPAFDPQRNLALVDHRALDQWEDESQERLRRLAAELHTLQQGAERAVAEQRSPFGTPSKAPPKARRPHAG